MLKIYCNVPTKGMEKEANSLGIPLNEVVLLHNIIMSQRNNPNYHPSITELRNLYNSNSKELKMYRYAIPYYKQGRVVNPEESLIERDSNNNLILNTVNINIPIEKYLAQLPKEAIQDITNRKELYTVLLWIENLKNTKNLSKEDSYKEAIKLLNEYKKLDPSYFEVSKPYKEIESFDKTGQLASTKLVNGQIEITIKKVITTEEFYNYIQGKSESNTSKQKELVLNEMERLGITLDRIKEVLDTSEKIKQFIYLHELSHKLNYKEDMSKYNREDINAPENIAIELRANLYAWEQINGVSNPFETTGNTDWVYEDVMNLFEGKSNKAKTKFSVSTSSSYPQRTRENVDWSDITLSLAVDFNTAGERLTKNAAKDKYVSYQLSKLTNKAEDIATILYNQIKIKGKTKDIKLNIAGNGIYSLNEEQSYYNDLMTEVLQKLLDKGITISTIRSGGQTGIDEAGIIAAQRLGIPNEVHATSNYMFRSKDGRDISDETQFKARFINTTPSRQETISSIMKEQQDNTPIKEDLPIIGTPNYDTKLKVDKESPRAILARELTPKQIFDRENLIAREFSNVVDQFLEDTIEETRELLETTDDNLLKLQLSNKLNDLNSDNGRKVVMQEVGFEAINDEIKNRFQDWIDMNDEDYQSVTGSSEKADYIREQYQKALDNYDTLFNDATIIIENNESIRLTETEVEDENGEKVHGNEGYTFKIRFVDTHESCRGVTRRALSNIKQVDSNGNPVLDDLANPSYLREDFVHSTLLGFLAKEVITPDDFVLYNREKDEYTFPALEKLQERFPWVSQIINKLAYDPNLISAFYTDFRKEFISYWAQFDGKPTRLNTPVEIDSTINGLISNYESGNKQDDNSVYNTDLSINKENVEKGKILANKIIKDLQKADDEDLVDISDEIMKLLRMLGFSEHNISKEIFLNEDNKTITRNVISFAKDILDKLPTLKEGSHYADTYDTQIENIARLIGKATELDATTTFREMGNDYPSYTAPNELEITFKKLKDNRYRKDFLENQFKKYDWFYPIINKNTGEKDWSNEVLKLIETDPNIRDNMELKNVFMLERQEYSDWNKPLISSAFVREYFYIKEDPKQDHNFGFFNFPIFSDTQMATFIKFKKYTGDFKSSLNPLFRKLVKQELRRMKLVEDRNKLGIPKISNFDTRGAKFCFLPELNNIDVTVDGEKRNLLDTIKYYSQEGYNRPDKIEEAISIAINNVMNIKFEEFIKNNKSLLEDKDLWTFISNNSDTSNGQTIENKLEEYFWNQTFMTSQLIQILTTDLAFYKNSVDFQKRFKEVYAAGTRLNTNSPYGRKVEKTIYISDDIMTSPTYKPLSKLFKEAYDNGKISKMDYDSILHKFKDINATDGQAYRSLSSYRSIMDMLGLWNEDLEATFNRLKSGEWNMGDINAVFQTIKPFVFGHVDTPNGLGSFMKVPHQDKNSEFLLLATYQTLGTALTKSEQLKALNDFMENNNIDVIQFESAVKVGGGGIININVSSNKLLKAINEEKINVDNKEYSIPSIEFKDITKTFKKLKDYFDSLLDKDTISQEEYNAVMEYFKPSYTETLDTLTKYTKTKVRETDVLDDEGFNLTSVHKLSYESYMIAQPTPEHVFDVESIFGSQFRNLIASDLPEDIEIEIEGTKIKGKDNVRKFYFSLIVENLLESYKYVANDFSNIEFLQKRLLSIVKGNPKYGRDMINALELVEYNGRKVFNMPFNDRMIAAKFEELMTSVFKNNITKQYINGASCIAVSNFGFTNELQVERNEDGSVKSIECYLPATSKKLYEPYLKEIVRNGNILGYEIDYNKIKKEDESLLELIGFRIPTEAKYSMLPLKIKGFLPQQNGSAIMLPAEVTTLSGADFDVDKFFLFLPSFNIENNKIERIKYDTSKESKDNSKAQRDNAIIQVALSILRNKEVGIASQTPGNFDTLKSTSRVSEIYTNKQYLAKYMKEYKLTDIKETIEHLLNNNLDTLDDFMKNNRVEDNPLTLDTFMKYHYQNMTGGTLIGIYANNTTMQAKLQGKNLRLKDSFTFTIDGKLIKNLTDVYTEEVVNGKTIKKRISQNCAEFSAASVDNVKDPVLASLLQNKDTASIACFMLRAGLSIPQIGALFNLPLVSDSIRNYGNLKPLDKICKSIEKKVKELKGIKNYKSPIITDFNTVDMIEATVLYNDIDILDNTQKIELYEKILGFAKGFQFIAGISEYLNETVRAYRADSPNGAIAISLAKAKAQTLRLNDILVKSNKVDYPFEGVDNILINDYLSLDDSIDEMREKLMNSEIPMLQAFYSLGIDLGLKTLSPYFANTSEKANQLIGFIQANRVKPLKDTDINNIYEAINLFGLSDTGLFGNDDNMSMEEKYVYYIKQFPRDFTSIVANNPDIKALPFIQKLVAGVNGIEMRNSARNTSYLRELLTNSADSLLYLDNPEAHKLAVGLLRYAYYKEKIKYGPNTFNQFFSTIFKNGFPEYIETLRELENSMETNSKWDRLLDQIYSNNPYLATEVSLGEEDKTITEDNKLITTATKLVRNPNYMAYQPLEYITDNGVLYKLNRELTDEMTVYYDKLEVSRKGFYNMNNDVNSSVNSLNLYEESYKQKIIEDNKAFTSSKERISDNTETGNIMKGNKADELFAGKEQEWNLDAFDALMEQINDEAKQQQQEEKYSSSEGLKEMNEKPCKINIPKDAISLGSM